MLSAARRFLILFMTFALFGVTTSQFAHGAEQGMAVVGMPCDMVMPGQALQDHPAPMAPCKTMTVDCLKQVGCVVDVALPAKAVSLVKVAPHTAVDYWGAWSNPPGLVREPETLPPRTI